MYSNNYWKQSHQKVILTLFILDPQKELFLHCIHVCSHFNYNAKEKGP